MQRYNYLFYFRLYYFPPFYIFCFSAAMSPNGPAVYDVFASPIKETVGFQGLQKCGWSVAWEWSVAE
jgi:hypothetical protein